MLDIKFIRQNPDIVREALEKRSSTIDLEALLTLDERRRELIQKADSLKSERNQFSASMSRAKSDGVDMEEKKKEMRRISDNIKAIDLDIRETEQGIENILMEIPNIPHESVPVGRDDRSNVEVRSWGTPPEFTFEPKPHWEIGEKLGILDFERASKLSGARFSLSFNAGAKLERALVNFMLDVHTKEHGYTEVLPPFLVNRESMQATGQLPKFEEDLFKTDDYFLIPTAEVPITNIFRKEVLHEGDLPIRFVAYTPCFRREAGSYGKDTRGLIRLHQFNKVELVRFAHPDHSYIDLEELTLDAEEILRKLGLHYRVMSLCSGDLGFSAAKTYDLEVWMPSQETHREISSCSNFEDFQARRAKIRMKSDDSKSTTLCHTLNGSGLAVGRTVAAILENYQNEDGSVSIPEVLRPYMGLDLIEPLR